MTDMGGSHRGWESSRHRGVRDGKADSVRQTVLTHEKLNARNTFEEPKVVVPKTREVKEHGDAIRCVLPPASVARLDVRLE